MKQKIKKDQPVPGRLTNLSVTVNSFVDTPANGQNFLVKKGMENVDKNVLEKSGINTETISKALENATPEQSEKVQTGLMTVIKSVLGLDKKDEPVTREEISKMLDEKLAVLVQKSTDNTQPATTTPDTTVTDGENDLAKENAELEQKIKVAKEENENKSELVKKNQELKKKLEDITSMRFGGNSSNKADNQQTLTAEEIKKKNDDSWISEIPFPFSH